jgi:hypothetical protein
MSLHAVYFKNMKILINYVHIHTNTPQKYYYVCVTTTISVNKNYSEKCTQDKLYSSFKLYSSICLFPKQKMKCGHFQLPSPTRVPTQVS